MDNAVITRVITVNSTGVFFERIWDGNTTSNWATLVDFLHHVMLAFDFTVFLGLVDSVLWWNVASFAWVAVSARGHG